MTYTDWEPYGDTWAMRVTEEAEEYLFGMTLDEFYEWVAE